MDQAAQDEGTTVLLDPIGGHKVDLATKQHFQAISQVDKAETNGFGEASQEVHIAACCLMLSGKGAKQLKAAELELGRQGWEVLAQNRQHLSAA
jgi:hypothetical protein